MRPAPSCSHAALFLIALSSDFTLKQVCEQACWALLSPHITFLFTRGHSDVVVCVCVCVCLCVCVCVFVCVCVCGWVVRCCLPATDSVLPSHMNISSLCNKSWTRARLQWWGVGVLVSNKTCVFSSQRIWELLSFGKTASPRWWKNVVPCEKHTHTHTSSWCWCWI